MKITEIMNQVIAEKTLFKRKNSETPLKLSLMGVVFEVKDPLHSFYHPLKKEYLFADDWEILENQAKTVKLFNFFNAYRLMKEGKIICRYRVEKDYKEKHFFLFDNAHGIIDLSGCSRSFSSVEIDAKDWVVIRDMPFELWLVKDHNIDDFFITKEE